MFAGILLLTPYYRLFTERLHDSYKYLLTISYIRPNHSIPCEYDDMPEEYVEKYRFCYDDPTGLMFFTAKTAVIWCEEQTKSR